MSDIDISAEIARLNAARDQDAHEEYLKASEAITGKQSTNPVATWVRALPKNITVGVMDAGIAMAHAADDFDTAMADNQKQKARGQRGEGVEGGSEPTAQELRLQSLATPMAEAHHGEVLPAVINFRDWMASGSSTSDDITQSVAQYAIPFMGFSKLVGGLRGASFLGTAARTATAESATAGTVLEPHSGRGADLLAMGRTVEGKFGEALRTVSPDGSALNAYIDYMTGRDGETTGGGRFKNIIDNLALTGAVSGLIKVTAGTLKGGLAVAQYAAENAGVGPVGPAAQGGKIVFHGTRHDFDEFDTSKVGTGEGNQTYGHGLYFAENPDVAGQYATTGLNSRLSKTDLAQYYTPGNVHNLSNGIKDTITAYDPSTGLITASRVDPGAGHSRPFQVSYRDTGTDWADLRRNLGQPLRQEGKTYTADIPDDKIGLMMRWDKDIQEQPKLQAAVSALNVRVAPEGNKFRVFVDDNPGHLYLTQEAAKAETNLLRGERPHETGGALYEQLAEALGGPQKASEYLKANGIPGIRYRDQLSRDGRSDVAATHNIVLFDAKDAKIVKKE